MRRTIKFGLTLAVAVLFTGCVNMTVGRPIPAENIKRITEGRTTADEITAMFGQPLRQYSAASGRVYIYRYIRPDTSTVQELIISFSEDESVTCYSKQGL